jgi:hypothetical protein
MDWVSWYDPVRLSFPEYSQLSPLLLGKNGLLQSESDAAAPSVDDVPEGVWIPRRVGKLHADVAKLKHTRKDPNVKYFFFIGFSMDNPPALYTQVGSQPMSND